ncbi:hypothetical protein [Helicovermis profundi]|uniref:Uncharacterized protein n=1 Tax=Helicovermis profundi TaxID=3065157 RepID=A0AAU9E9E5_9FIRM|nr:hypothetical protein HLPR_17080 [Clostridia bacterium S502]
MTEENKKKGGSFKVVLVLLLVFFILPGGVITGVYFLNQSFKTQANDILSNVPGPVGNYFDSFPTPQENTMKIKKISDYMLTIETTRAIDKLLVLKSDDTAVYNSVIKSMLRTNPNRTEIVLEGVRDSTMKKDVIANTIDQINTETSDELKKKADYLTSISVSTAIDEMKNIIKSSINGYKDLAAIVNVMDSEKASTLLKFMNKEDFDKTFEYIPFEKNVEIKKAIANDKNRRENLKNIADIYSTEDVNKLIDTIGNTKTYTIDELSVLYNELGPIKAGKILSKISDDTFTFNLINSIKENQVLENGKDTVTKDILKSLKIYKSFDDNTKELSDVYNQMTSDKVALLIKNMVRNSARPTEYTLDNGEKIVLTDEDIALSLLKSFSNKKISEILSLLDNNLASDLSRKMTLPN